MKRTHILLFCLLPLLAVAQEHMISVGLRGGQEKLNLHSTHDFTDKFKPAENFDLRYTWYAPSRSDAQFGILTGLSVGFGKSHYEGHFEDQFVNTDYLGMDLLYTTSGTMHADLKRLYAEMPLFLGLRVGSFILRAGPKMQVPLWSKAQESLSDGLIDAYYSIPDVHVVNELITGVVTDNQLQQSGNWQAPRVNLLIGGEVGFEWSIQERHRLGLVAYADYGLWNNHKQASAPIIGVAPIADPVNPVPAVTVQEATGCAVSKMHPLQVGLSLYYGIACEKRYHVKKKDPQVLFRTDTIHHTDTVHINRTVHDTIVVHDTVTLKETIIRIDTAFIYHPAVHADERALLETLAEGIDKKVAFANASSTLPEDERLTACLDKIADILKRNPQMRIRVEGHTDSTGKHVTNIAVGQRRANTFKLELTNRGVSDAQVEAISKAELEPIAPNDTPEHRALNRRIEVKLIK